MLALQLDQSLFPLLIAGSSALAVLLLFSSALSIARSHKRTSRIKDRLSGKRQTDGAATTSKNTTKVVESLTQTVQQLGERLGPSEGKDIETINSSLLQAGITHRHASRIFWGVKILLAVLALAGASFFALTAQHSISPSLMGLIVLLPCVAGLYAPNIWLSYRITQRRKKILHAFPDALDLLVVCVEAGMGLDQAIDRVSRELKLTSADLAYELHTVILELRAGKPRAEALKNLSTRIQLEDVTSLVTLIIQAETFGTSITSTLRVYSDHMRTTRQQRAEECAAKVPVKLLFPLILTILPVLLVTILGSASITLQNSFSVIK